MNRFWTAILGLALMLMCSVNSFAADKMYVSGKLGFSLQNDSDLLNSVAAVSSETEFETGLFWAVALGYDFGNNVRAEGEFSYSAHDIENFNNLRVNNVSIGSSVGSGDVTAVSYLLNLFYDIQTDTEFTPYVGGGAGIANIYVDNISVAGISLGDSDDFEFAYQVGCGVSRDFFVSRDNTVTGELGYRYFGTGDPQFGNTSMEYHSHNLFLAVRHTF